MRADYAADRMELDQEKRRMDARCPNAVRLRDAISGAPHVPEYQEARDVAQSAALDAIFAGEDMTRGMVASWLSRCGLAS